jgi:hypothetical protein
MVVYLKVQYFIDLEKIFLCLKRFVPKTIIEKLSETEYTCRVRQKSTKKLDVKTAL